MANEHLRLLSTRYGATVVHLCRKFLNFPLSLPLTPGLETDETAFKGVQIMQITLTLAGF